MVEIEWWVERSGVVGFHYLTHIYTHTHTQNTYLHCKLQVLAGEVVGLCVLLHLSIGVPYTPACFGSTKPIEERANSERRTLHYTSVHPHPHSTTYLHTQCRHSLNNSMLWPAPNLARGVSG